MTPAAHPTLTPFCTALTGIAQRDVDAPTGVPFAEALRDHTAWLVGHGLLDAAT
ncbi:MAG: hypothetical protein QF920_10945, partial [Verrucomicrobiota bacterium]|nr:hypothetical protein [Verrucomicrobiota bacterium]